MAPLATGLAAAAIEWGDAGPGQRLLLRSLRLMPPDTETGL